jgi:predicted naringenin-chalcone synthase
LAYINAIGTAVPAYQHQQSDILHFMQEIYQLSDEDYRKLRFLYNKSGIQSRYSVIPDFSLPPDAWTFYPHALHPDSFPLLEKRMARYQSAACDLAIQAIDDARKDFPQAQSITHLITVSCTGMSAPGLDIELMAALGLPPQTFRTSVHFMGCYAALHALRMAQAFCATDPQAQVLIVCVELCTLHFQQSPTADNISSSLLFADGAAAAWVSNAYTPGAIELEQFYAEVHTKGQDDMTWTLSSNGFLMTLSGYVPELIRQDFHSMLGRAAQHFGISLSDIRHWAVHPGGKRILEAVQQSLDLGSQSLDDSYAVLQQFGNMSSATVLFVLKSQMQAGRYQPNDQILLAAFGPGITMETALLKYPAHV